MNLNLCKQLFANNQAMMYSYKRYEKSHSYDNKNKYNSLPHSYANDSQNQNIELILPYTNNYIDYDEYLELEYKKNRYQNTNIGKVLARLNYPYMNSENDVASVVSRGVEVNGYIKLENNFSYDLKENISCFSDEVLQINRIIQTEIREYIPKNFRIIKK